MSILIIVCLSIIIYEFVFPILSAVSIYLQNMMILSQKSKEQQMGILEEETEQNPEEYVNAIGFHVDNAEYYEEDEEGDIEDGRKN